MNQEVVGTKKVMQGAEGWGSSEDVEWSRDLKGRGRETVYSLGRERIPGRRDRKCKGPEAGACLAFLSSRVTSMITAEGRRETGVQKRPEKQGKWTTQGLTGHCEDLNFI